MGARCSGDLCRQVYRVEMVEAAMRRAEKMTLVQVSALIAATTAGSTIVAPNMCDFSRFRECGRIPWTEPRGHCIGRLP